MKRSAPADPLIISYLTLRRLVGCIAILLPPILLMSSWLSARSIDIYVTSTTVVSSKLPDSVSGYYYTGMRNFFVGSLCALGVFLIGYNGYDEIDRWTTNAAGVLAICVAFFPTTPSVNPSSSQRVIGTIHLSCAGLLFLLLALMALRFAKTSPGAEPETFWGRLRAGLGLANTWIDPEGSQTRRKKRRNVVYRSCALVILVSMGLAVAANFLPVSVRKITPTLFWFETAAILAFGLSWFVKGRSLLTVLRRLGRPDIRAALGARPDAAPDVRLVGAAQLTTRAGAPAGEEATESVLSGLAGEAEPRPPGPQRAAELWAELS